jgi:hypothetical protein
LLRYVSDPIYLFFGAPFAEVARGVGHILAAIGSGVPP